MRLKHIFFGALALLAVICHSQSISALTFSKNPKQIYVPFRKSAEALGIEVIWDSGSQKAGLGTVLFEDKEFEYLWDDSKVIELDVLKKAGIEVKPGTNSEEWILSFQGKEVIAKVGEKRVEVSISDQRLHAWQGDVLVMDTNVSTGRAGHRTPQGSFKTGPSKSKMHYSRLYNNSPMPYSVQVHGDVFIHGYHSVPSYPASHGCIRMPLKGRNAAKYFYNWVDLNIPVEIASDFKTSSDVSLRLSSKS